MWKEIQFSGCTELYHRTGNFEFRLRKYQDSPEWVGEAFHQWHNRTHPLAKSKGNSDLDVAKREILAALITELRTQLQEAEALTLP